MKLIKIHSVCVCVRMKERWETVKYAEINE